MLSPEISAPLVQLFYGYIMITLATDIVQQLYVHVPDTASYIRG
jgi:hypothetical protein